MVKSAMPFTLIQRITRTTTVAAVADARLSPPLPETQSPLVRKEDTDESPDERLIAPTHMQPATLQRRLSPVNWGRPRRQNSFRKSQVSFDATLRVSHVTTQFRIFAADRLQAAVKLKRGIPRRKILVRAQRDSN